MIIENSAANNGVNNNIKVPAAKRADVLKLMKDFDVSERIAKLTLQKFQNNFDETYSYMSSTTEYYTGLDK